MRHVVAVTLLVALAGTAAAQGRPGSTDVVLEQIDAFRRGDFTAAYAFASSAIKRQFDLAAFERMVRAGYPEIAAPAEASVLERILVPDGREYVRLRVRGKSGSAVEALYELVEEEGAWKIEAVVTRPAPGPI